MSIETVTVTKAGLDALREDRNELSRDYRKLASDADELRQQRDEALQALRDLLDTPTGELSTRRAVDILAQYEEGDA